MQYNDFGTWLRKRFPDFRVQKISIDAGFTCPNRDGKCGTGGCAFCSSDGSGEHIATTLPVKEQIINFKKRLNPKLSGSKFLIYFQNFTNTYAPVNKLRELFSQAIECSDVVALAVATRPDCIDRENAALLAELNKKVYVWVELGLQTSSDKSANYFNRGYKTEVFSKAVDILNEFGVDAIAHLIIGLPNETKADFINTIEFVNSHKLQGVKLHSLYISEGTRFADMYKKGEFTVQSEEQYIDWVLYAITHLSPDFVLHRLMGTCTPEKLIAPKWNTDKNRILMQINNTLTQNDWRQGCFYSAPACNK